MKTDANLPQLAAVVCGVTHRRRRARERSTIALRLKWQVSRLEVQQVYGGKLVPQPGPTLQPLKTILGAGLLAGFLDGMDAVVAISMIAGVPAIRVFQFIASGVLGLKAFQGGGATAALGVVLHFTIAIGAAAVFYVLSRMLPMLLRKPLLWGPVYGIVVFIFMHYLVVPLSAAPRQPPAGAIAILNLIFSHVFFVGIPIALITSRTAPKPR